MELKSSPAMAVTGEEYEFILRQSCQPRNSTPLGGSELTVIGGISIVWMGTEKVVGIQVAVE